jgi:HAD superfamily hydrolase (TIGR01509 family)
MNLADRRYWIFDMDGTLTVAAHDFAAIKQRLGLSPDTPILEQLAELPVARASELRAQLDVIELEIARQSEIQPGARGLLEALTRSGAQVAILTRNSRTNAMETLSGCDLLEFFDARFIFGRESSEPKPSGAGIRRMLQQWKASADEAVMVGDFLFDLQAGRDAGTLTVYFDPGGTREYATFADICVESLDELRELFG